MTQEKFQTELKTLEKFFSIYCQEKHQNQYQHTLTLLYKEKQTLVTLDLCKECHELIGYSLQKLQECPHEIKPRCRKCPNPCYEKQQWKALAKLMRYSGMQLGILKIKHFFKLD